MFSFQTLHACTVRIAKIFAKISYYVQGYFYDLESGGCKIKVGRISSPKKMFFSTPQMGCKHHPMGGANTPVFDID